MLSILLSLILHCPEQGAERTVRSTPEVEIYHSVLPLLKRNHSIFIHINGVKHELNKGKQNDLLICDIVLVVVVVVVVCDGEGICEIEGLCGYCWWWWW